MAEQNIKLDTKNDTRDNVDNKISALREDYQRKLAGKITNVEQLWEKLSYFNWSDEAFHILNNFVHTLTGSGKTFGFSRLSDCARELEEYLNEFVTSHQVPDENQQKKISQLIDELHRASESPDIQAPVINKVTPSNQQQKMFRSKQLIYIVDDDVHTAEYISNYIMGAGYNVQIFHQIKDMYEALKHASPATVIMDIMFPEGSLAGIDTVNNIRVKTGVRTPILFISSRADVTARLRVVRAGGDAYFTKPINIDGLIDKLDEIAHSIVSEGHRVLLIEDDVFLAEHYEIILQKAGMITEIVSQPMKTIQAIQKFKPDILLMDMKMPDINGLELASIIRHEEKLIRLPIIFVTGESSPELRNRAIKMGGDEFLTKPVSDKELVDVTHHTIIKSKRLNNTIKQVSRNDLETGMINRKSFLADLEKEVATCKEKQGTRALIFVTIDHFDTLSKKIGITGLEPLANELALRIQNSLGINDEASQMAEGVFTIIAKDINETELKQLTQIIYKNVTDTTVSIEEHTLEIDSCIGADFITHETLNIQNILTKTEKLAAKASEQGEDKIQINKQLISTEEKEADLRNKIVRAIKEKSFRLVFQPILNVANEEKEVYEVLLRMVDEENKVILPAQFFPIAKQENLLHEVDRWAIENAIQMLSDNVRIRTRGTFFIKVNGESITKDSFITWICNCISNTRLRGEQKVVFEMSEKDIINRIEEVESFSTLLKNMSCGFAVEHFGSTNQHKALIDNIPIDFVKIDMPKESQLHDDSNNEKLKSFIEYIQSKNKNIIVSMVDDPRTVTKLWDWGVQYFQGYFIEEPHESLDFDFTRGEMFKNA